MMALSPGVYIFKINGYRECQQKTPVADFRLLESDCSDAADIRRALSLWLPATLFNRVLKHVFSCSRTAVRKIVAPLPNRRKLHALALSSGSV